MKFLDLFAGIGGFRLGMEQAGHECIGFCEIDKYARASYKAIHDTKGEIEWHDITSVSDESIRGIGSVDVICGGFPCQAFSLAGERRGFEDTRGTLFFEIARIASILRPKHLFLENVRGLLNHDDGNTFETILRTLDGMGYNVEWQVLNSKNFGVPQNRERVFIIGHLRGERTERIFPITRQIGKSDFEPKIKILGNTKNPERSNLGTRTIVHDTSGIVGALTAMDYKSPKQIAVNGIGKIKGNYDISARVYEIDGLATSLTAMQGGGQEPKIIQKKDILAVKEATVKGYSEATIGDSVNLAYSNSNKRRGRVGKQIANTILTGGSQGVVTENLRIRKLTPRECWRLQGFPDWAFDKAREVNSNSQLYKQAGNSVTVNVIYEIAKNLKVKE